MPSKRVIVLERLVSQEAAFGNQAPQCWSYVFWADVPAARATFYANVGFTSAVRDVSAPDLAALQAGTVVESLRTLKVDKSSTLGQLQTQLENEWVVYQAEVTAFNPWNRYGTFWNGTSWTAGGAT